MNTPHIIKPLRYLRDQLVEVGPNGEKIIPREYRNALLAAQHGNGKFVQELARYVYKKRSGA